MLGQYGQGLNRSAAILFYHYVISLFKLKYGQLENHQKMYILQIFFPILAGLSGADNTEWMNDMCAKECPRRTNPM